MDDPADIQVQQETRETNDLDASELEDWLALLFDDNPRNTVVSLIERYGDQRTFTDPVGHLSDNKLVIAALEVVADSVERMAVDLQRDRTKFTAWNVKCAGKNAELLAASEENNLLAQRLQDSLNA
ncbi:MAG: hypothetical protein AAF903_15765 [Pseudomonadota bacterium]